MSPIVVIGSGLAGYTVIRELRKLDPAVPITLICADHGDFYAKPMLSNAFVQGKSVEQLIATPAEKMAAQLKIDLMADTQVNAIDPQACRLTTSRGPVAYGRLVLALGAAPFRLPLAGDAAGEVLSINNLSDYAVFYGRLAGVRHVAILGAGLIGCEFANDLAGAGYRVSVFDPSAYPLSALLPETAGQAMIEPLASQGVQWQLGQCVTAVDREKDGKGKGYRLTLNSGGIEHADLVLSAVGLRPSIALAQAAGIVVERGIVVGRNLQTSVPGIYALGDCAQIDGQIRPFVLPIMHAAKALAQTLAGNETEVVFPAMPVVVKTPACPVAVQPVARDVEGQWLVEQKPGGLKMTFTAPGNRLVGFALTGACVEERVALARVLEISAL